MNENTLKIIQLADGIRSSVEISGIVGLTPRYVRKVLLKYNLPRRHCGAGRGKLNHQYRGGRIIQRDGYALVTVYGHPFARKYRDWIPEHRFALENKLGRYILPTEIVDHIDGLKLHNHPDNLRLFSSNSEHLKQTLTGNTPKWSLKGKKNILANKNQPPDYQPVDSYQMRLKLGEVRLQQILLAWLKLHKDSPYLLGTKRYLKKAQIDFSSRSKIKRALDDLYHKWEWDQTQLELELNP